LRLDAEDDHVGFPRDVRILAAADAVRLDQLPHALRPAGAHEDLLGPSGLRVQEALEQRLSHVAGADEPEHLVRDHDTRYRASSQCCKDVSAFAVTASTY